MDRQRYGNKQPYRHPDGDADSYDYANTDDHANPHRHNNSHDHADTNSDRYWDA
jgi:hypothetical protein